MTDDHYETDDPYNYRWTLAAFDAIKAGTLHRKILRDNGISVAAQVTGSCPRCGDELVPVVLPLRTVINDGVLGREVVTRSAAHPVDVLCGCSQIHTGAPPTVKGCGIGFRVELKEGRDG